METESSVLSFKGYFSNQLVQTSLKIKLNPDLLTPLSFWFRFFRALYKLLKHANAVEEESVRTFLWFSCLCCSSSLLKHSWVWICFRKELFAKRIVALFWWSVNPLGWLLCLHALINTVLPSSHHTLPHALTWWHTQRLTKSAENIRMPALKKLTGKSQIT